jgi:hypothetical protein
MGTVARMLALALLVGGLGALAACGEEDAESYAADERVLGVIGTYNSGCAARRSSM